MLTTGQQGCTCVLAILQTKGGDCWYHAQHTPGHASCQVIAQLHLCLEVGTTAQQSGMSRELCQLLGWCITRILLVCCG